MQGRGLVGGLLSCQIFTRASGGWIAHCVPHFEERNQDRNTEKKQEGSKRNNREQTEGKKYRHRHKIREKKEIVEVQTTKDNCTKTTAKQCMRTKQKQRDNEEKMLQQDEKKMQSKNKIHQQEQSHRPRNRQITSETERMPQEKDT